GTSAVAGSPGRSAATRGLSSVWRPSAATPVAEPAAGESIRTDCDVQYFAAAADEGRPFAPTAGRHVPHAHRRVAARGRDTGAIRAPCRHEDARFMTRWPSRFVPPSGLNATDSTDSR